MSKKMTPRERLGYKVGDKFTVVDDSYKFGVGSVIYLQDDDGTELPYFTNEIVKDEYPDGVACRLRSIKKVAKLKPAKQALADAIHQNGGWKVGNFAVYGKISGVCAFCDSKPHFDKFSHGWWVSSCGEEYEFKIKPFVNWHQTCLSRDEYFTAYPEQKKVEAVNNTDCKLEIKVTSDARTMEINAASDWHKNGELPPIGEVCVFDANGRDEFFDEKAIKANGKNVSIIAHVKFKNAVGSVAVFMCDAGGVAIVRSANETCFRPLRTEREEAIDAMVDCLSSRWANCEEMAEHLYDNGYRKEVK